jgi:mono/diheme cytochrome c family protein
MRRSVVTDVGAILTLGALVVGCTESAPLPPVERGRRVYMANCIVCHNPDPTKPGASGPEVAGASRDLLEARVVHGTYPPGYTPKRTTKAMVPLPYLANRLDDLAAFLAAAGNR